MEQSTVYTLGLYLGHNSSVTLLKDGVIVAAVSEERFSRNKNDSSFPHQSVRHVCALSGITLDHVTFVVVSNTTPIKSLFQSVASGPVSRARSSYTLSTSISSIIDASGTLLRTLFGRSRLVGSISDTIYTVFHSLYTFFFTEPSRRRIAQLLSISPSKIYFYDHQESHAASYYFSPFKNKQCLVFTLDGQGDNDSGASFVFDNTGSTNLARVSRSSSLGWFFGLVTEHLGMKFNEHEYKVMGLAPYGTSSASSSFSEAMASCFEISCDTNPTIRAKFKTQYTRDFLRRNFRDIRFDILAASAQHALEKIVTSWIRQTIARTGIHSVVLAGGVFMNIKLNKLIAELPEVHEVWIMPSCSDETSSLGASALHLARRSLNVERLENMYLGTSYDNTQVLESITKCLKNMSGVSHAYHENIDLKVAELLNQGQIVARFCGQMEFGARALGNRSILADPRDPKVIRKINEAIKNRDFWMPFAPSVLDAFSERYFLTNAAYLSEYMMFGYESTPLAREVMPAALHPYDFTARPQIVTLKTNSRYYGIIRKFSELSGVGAVLNTSFNLHGYPIVESPEDAIGVFLRSDLRFLALENFLVCKQ